MSVSPLKLLLLPRPFMIMYDYSLGIAPTCSKSVSVQYFEFTFGLSIILALAWIVGAASLLPVTLFIMD